MAYTAGDGKTLYFEPDGQGGYVAPVGFDLELVAVAVEDEGEEEGEGTEGAEDSGEGEPDGPEDAGESNEGEPEGADAGSDEGADEEAADEGADGGEGEAGDEEEEDPVTYRYELRSSDGSARLFDPWGMLTEVRSAKGLSTTLERDELGRIVRITGPSGASFELASDERGRISEVLLPDGNKLAYAYDEHDNLVSFTGADGGTVTYSYDEQHRMTEWRDAKGTRIVKNLYDDEGRVTCQWDAAGNASTLAYAEGSTTTMDAEGHVTVHRYDELMRTTSVTYPDGYEVSRAYDDANNLVSDEDGTYAYDGHGRMTSATENGATTTWAYDERGRLVESAAPDGTVTDLGYDAMGNLAWVATNAGDATSFSYDGLGRCLSMADADGVTATFSWEGANLTAALDGLGNATTMAYDAMGRAVSVTDALGNTARTVYDAAGRVVGEQDATGAYTAYHLDAAGLLESVADPRGYVTSFTYDEAYNIASMTDALGNVTTWEYDALGNQLAEVGPTGAREERAYDARGRLASATDGEGGTTSFAYDGRGRVTAATNPLGGTERYAYQGTWEAPTEATDALGNATRYDLDALGRVVRTTYADGAVESVRYGLGGRLEGATDAVGLATSYAYTRAGRLASIDEGGRVTSIGYDALGNAVSATGPDGSTVRFAYDAAGNLVEETDALGNATAYAYDAAGRVTAEADALGQTVTVAYDAAGNVVEATDAQGRAARYAYDAAGNLAKATDREGATRAFGYDGLGQLTSVTEADGSVTGYAFDKAGNLTQVADALGRRTIYSYDAAGDLTAIESPSGSVEAFSYDVMGRLVSESDGAGSEVRYGYDAVGNVSSKSHSQEGAQPVSYAFDAAGRVIGRTDATGTASFERDELGRLVAEENGLGQRLGYSYDAMGNLASVSYPNGEQVAYSYDAAGSLTAVDAPEGAYRYAYDALGRPTSLSRPDGTSTAYAYGADGNVAQVENIGPDGGVLSRFGYSYDAEGRISSEASMVRDTGGAEHATARAFGYDGLGRVSSVDAAGTDGTYSERYSYDGAGNRTRLVRTGDGADEVRYSYDADDRLVREESASHGTTTYSYDAAGQLVSKRSDGDGETTYDYGMEGRLEAVRQGGRTLMAATYDGDGDRVMQASPFHHPVEGTDGTEGGGPSDAAGSGEDGDALASCDGLSLFWYGFFGGLAGALSAPNPAVVVSAVEGACALVESTWPEGALDPEASGYALSELSRLGIPSDLLLPAAAGLAATEGEPGSVAEGLDVVTYANSHVLGSVTQVAASSSTRSGESHEAYGLDRLSKSTGGATESYAYDGRGSVAQTLSGSGAVASWHVWGTFGEQEAGSSLGELPAYGYNAEESHPQTGLTYLRARYYDASTGRFGVQDSYLGSVTSPLTLNRYLYCLSDALNWIDPTGFVSKAVQRRMQRFDSSRSNRTGRLGSYVVDVHKKTSSPLTRSKVTSKLSPSAWVSYSERVKVGTRLSNTGNASYASWWHQTAAQYRANVVTFYCGNAERMRVDDQARFGIKFPEEVHTGLQIASFFIPVIADWTEGALRRIEGDYEGSSDAFVNSLLDAYTAGTGKKGQFAAASVEFVLGAKKGAKVLTKAEKMSMTAEEIIVIDRKGSVRSEFPGQWLNSTLTEIEAAAKRGDGSAQTAYKILTDARFSKGDNRK